MTWAGEWCTYWIWADEMVYIGSRDVLFFGAIDRRSGILSGHMQCMGKKYCDMGRRGDVLTGLRQER